MGIIQKQGIANAVVTYLGILIGFLNLIVIQPLFLTPEEIGLTRILFSFSSLVAVFLPMGVANVTVKYFPKFRNREERHHGFFGFMMLFPLAGFLFTSLILYLFKDFFIARYINESPIFTEYFTYVIPLSFFLGFVNVLNVYCYSLFKTTVPVLLNDVIIRIFSIAVIALYFIKVITLDQFIFLFVSVYGLQLTGLLIYIFRVDKPGLKINFNYVKEQNVKEIFNYGFLLAFASIASLGLKYLDSIMIGAYLPLAFVGIYTIAAFIPTIIEAPLNALEKITNTKIADALAHNDHGQVKEIYYKSSRYMLLLGGLLFVGININSASLLSFLPDDYSKGANVIFIISLGALFNMASGSNTSIIFSSERYKFGAFLLIFLVLIAFISNLIFIPLYGIEGAAIATSLSAFIYGFIRYAFIKKNYNLQPYDINTFKITVLIISGFVISYLLPLLNLPLLDIIYRSAVITIFYCTGTYFMKIVPELHKHIPLWR